jgi:hypothetical protein
MSMKVYTDDVEPGGGGGCEAYTTSTRLGQLKTAREVKLEKK